MFFFRSMHHLTKQLLTVKNWIRASGFDPLKKRKYIFFCIKAPLFIVVEIIKAIGDCQRFLN